MRARGSNHHPSQNLSARVHTRRDPDGRSSSSSSSNGAAGSATATAAATSTTTKPRKFAVPGNRKPKRPLEFRPALRRKQDASGNGSADRASSSHSSSSSSILPLVVAVCLWYSLGVVSISSSKVLLTPYQGSGIDDAYLDDEYEAHALYQHVGGLPPLVLTVQQLLLGSTFLRLAIQFKFLGLTEGLVPVDALLESLGSGRRARRNNTGNNNTTNPVPRYLVNTGIFFALGFLTTNMAFGAAAPTYVETLKAAEPITSAIFAVLWGIEVLTFLEVLGLMGIIGGVLLSTSGSNHSASMAEGAGSSLVVATAIVLASNLCFSLRGLYQKLFRKGAAALALAETEAEATEDVGEKSSSSSRPRRRKALDDLNLQFRMQQTGVLLLAIPMLVWHGPSLVRHATGAASNLPTHAFCKVLQQYAIWSIGNGLAFSSYNLASTYLLTRISVVHHAALNCTRRIFAIVCTGILFRIPVSLESAVGIAISFVGFMVFTKAKTMKNQKAAAAAALKQHKTKNRDVPIGNGELSSSDARETVVLPQEEVLPSTNGGMSHQPHYSTTTSTTTYTNGTHTATSRAATLHTNGLASKSDFGTHRRANASSAASKNATTTTAAAAAKPRFPLPPPPGNNRSIHSPFPRPPPPPPPPPPPSAPSRMGY